VFLDISTVFSVRSSANPLQLLTISQVRRFIQKGRAMQYRDLKQLRGELVQLIEKQIETLAKETCDSLTDTELRKYDDRKKRIDKLYDALHDLDPAA
jgi:hypothetical protein